MKASMVWYPLALKWPFNILDHLSKDSKSSSRVRTFGLKALFTVMAAQEAAGAAAGGAVALTGAGAGGTCGAAGRTVLKHCT